MSNTPHVAVPSLHGNVGFARAVRALGIAGIALLLLASAIALLLSVVLAALVLLAGMGLLGYSLVELFLAKSRVLSGQEVMIWKGTAKLVSWNPTEGVVFLRNKQIDFIDDNLHDGGGIRVLYPLLGEELVLRVPLEIQTLPFEDREVLTKEYMPLTIQGTMYWKIVDLSRFYLYISREVHSVKDSGKHTVVASASRPQFEVAEQWLRAMAEEKTRTIVSRIGTGLLISDQLLADLSKALPSGAPSMTTPESSSSYRNASESLASTIKAEFESSAREYGLEIHRVALQEVRLPPEIYAAAVDACKSAYLPLKAQAEALEIKLKLQAEADVIGKDAAGMKAIAGNIPALAFQDFLAPLFLNFNRMRAATAEGEPSKAGPGA